MDTEAELKWAEEFFNSYVSEATSSGAYDVEAARNYGRFAAGVMVAFAHEYAEVMRKKEG